MHSEIFAYYVVIFIETDINNYIEKKFLGISININL